MMEIILIWSFGSKLAEKCKKKGHPAAGYVTIFVVLWIVCELLGVILGAVVGDFLAVGEFSFLMSYGLGLIGAVFGALTGFAIVNRLPDRTALPALPGDLPPEDGEWRRRWDERDAPRDADGRIQQR